MKKVMYSFFVLASAYLISISLGSCLGDDPPPSDGGTEFTLYLQSNPFYSQMKCDGTGYDKGQVIYETTVYYYDDNGNKVEFSKKSTTVNPDGVNSQDLRVPDDRDFYVATVAKTVNCVSSNSCRSRCARKLRFKSEFVFSASQGNLVFSNGWDDFVDQCC